MRGRYVCCLPIPAHGSHNNGASAGSTRLIVAEAAEGRLHNGGWGGGAHNWNNYYISGMAVITFISNPNLKHGKKLGIRLDGSHGVPWHAIRPDIIR